MAALTLNLLVEQQLAQQERARDPVKIVAAIGIGLLAATVGIGVYVGHQAEQKRNAADALQAEWEKLQIKQTSMAGSDTKALKTLADDLMVIHLTRPVYAAQLALVKDVIPETVQLTAIDFKLVSEAAESRAPAKGAGDGEAPAKARPSRPVMKDHVELVLNGVATSPRPELEVDQFLKSLREHPVFGKVVREFRLRSIARSSSPGESASLPSAIFVIECLYKEAQ